MHVALASFCEAQDAHQTASDCSILSRFRQERLSGRCGPCCTAQDFSLHGLLAEHPSGRNARYVDWKAGDRATAYGFGFLVLFNGRPDAQLRRRDAAALGTADGKAAAAAAAREGFRKMSSSFSIRKRAAGCCRNRTLICLPGSMRFAAQVRGPEFTVRGSTCQRAKVPSTRLGTLWSRRPRGSNVREQKVRIQERRTCSFGLPTTSARLRRVARLRLHRLAGVSTPPIADFVTVWQYAQSPFRSEFSASCRARPAPDGNCYATDPKIFVDLNTARSPDPSDGAR